MPHLSTSLNMGKVGKNTVSIHTARRSRIGILGNLTSGNKLLALSMNASSPFCSSTKSSHLSMASKTSNSDWIIRSEDFSMSCKENGIAFCTVAD